MRCDPRIRYVSHWVLIIAICCKVKVRGPKTSASGVYRHTQAVPGHAINGPHITLGSAVPYTTHDTCKVTRHATEPHRASL